MLPYLGKLHVDNIFEEEFGSLKSSGQGAWSELSKVVVSNLSESVVSLASFDGDYARWFLKFVSSHHS